MKQISVLILALAVALGAYNPQSVPEVGFSECALSQTVKDVEGDEGVFQFYVFKGTAGSD